jgi:ferric-dicitrate binding protein FerR (iron transport regulator)
MADDLRLQAGQDLALHGAAGSELFCAAGSVRVTLAGGALPPRVLPAGQALRVPDGAVLLVSALAPSRCRWTQGREPVAPDAAPNENSLRPWGRRLSTEP